MMEELEVLTKAELNANRQKYLQEHQQNGG